MNDGSTIFIENLKADYSQFRFARIFPNPTDTYLNILLDDVPKEGVTVSLENVIGYRFILQEPKGQKMIQLDVNNLPNGLYLRRISQKGKRDFTKPVVVQK